MSAVLTIVETTTELGIEITEVILVSSSTPGPAGPGVPAGGTDGQVLTKTSATDYATAWEDPTGGGGASAAEDVTFDPAGSVASIDVQAAIEELDSEKQSASQVLAAIATALAAADGAALSDNGSGVLSVVVDDSTIEISSDAIRVKSGGITTAHLNFDPATQAELDAAIAALSTVYQAKDVTLDTYAGIDPSANVQSILGAANYAAIRTLLGLVIGTNVQAWDADLDTYAGITPSANVQSILSAANYAAIRTLLGLVIGTNVQAWDADLDTYAGITPSANVQSLLAAASYAAMRALLDLEAGTDFPSLATFNDHSGRHEDGGGDEMSIAGLAGIPTELQTHLDDTTAHTAANIPFTPNGSIASDNVQDAIQEVRDEATGGSSAVSFIPSFFSGG